MADLDKPAGKLLRAIVELSDERLELKKADERLDATTLEELGVRRLEVALNLPERDLMVE